MEAAIEEFLAHGFHGGRMDRIAERAEVSKRTVYKHFRSKQALFDAMIQHMQDGFRAATAATYSPDRPLADQLRDIARAEGDLFTSRSFMKLTRLMTSEVIRNPELARKLAGDRSGEDEIEAFFANAMAAGAVRNGDPSRAGRQFFALLKGQAFWPMLHGRRIFSREEMNEVIEESISLFLSHYSA